MKVELIDEYEQKTAELADFINGVSAVESDFKPALAGAWSIDEHLRHLLAIELNSFVMYNDELLHIAKILPELSVLQDNKQILVTYHRLRRAVVNSMCDKEPTETILTIKSSVHGTLEMDVEFTLRALNNHVDTHMEFMTRNVKEFLKQGCCLVQL